MFCGKTSNRKNKTMGTPMGCLRKGIGIGLGLAKKKTKAAPKKAPPKKAAPKKAPPKKAAPKKAAPKKAPRKKAAPKKAPYGKLLAIKAPPKSKLNKKEKDFIAKKDKLKKSISKLLSDDDYSQYDESDKRKMGNLEDELEDLLTDEKEYYRKKLG